MPVLAEGVDSTFLEQSRVMEATRKATRLSATPCSLLSSCASHCKSKLVLERIGWKHIETSGADALKLNWQPVVAEPNESSAEVDGQLCVFQAMSLIVLQAFLVLGLVVADEVTRPKRLAIQRDS